jgi:hypothetical protein
MPNPQTIELDCPPGNPRPGDLIEKVIEGTGLLKKESAGRVFGNWTWDYSEIPPEEWKKIQLILKERISNLYDQGLIRFGSW